MTRAAKSLSALALGILLMVAGIFGWIGDLYGELIIPGLLLLLLGTAALATTQSRDRLTTPHPLFYGVLALAVAFHVHQSSTMSGSFGWFLWALSPYVLAFGLSCFSGSRIPAIAGAVLALPVDMWNLYEVKSSTSSTAAINFSCCSGEVASALGASCANTGITAIIIASAAIRGESFIVVPLCK